MARFDAIVIGGGLVGSAIAYGLAREGLKTALLDEGDVAYRASRGNFGLVWVQSKGDGAPHYQRWTRLSADLWPALAAELQERTGIAVGHERPGGVHLCLGDEEFAARRLTRPDSPLGRDYLAGQGPAAALRTGKARYLPRTTLWHLDPDGTLFLAVDGRTSTIEARRVNLATGALERPAPIPGWTLPGVMSAGAAQVLLKSADLVPAGRVVLAGQGPLVHLIAAQLADAGAPPVAILETTPFENYWAAARYLDRCWPGRRMLLQGLGLILAARRAGIPIRHGVRGLRAVGRNQIERVVWDGGELAADLLLLHEGVIPNVQISLALQLRHGWDEAQLCWRPALDEWGATSLANAAIAGDGGGILGAEAAALSGRLAALDAALRLGCIDIVERDRRAAPIRAVLDRKRALRPFLDALYRPAHEILVPDDEDIIACRCEEVTVGQIRRAARLGAAGPNQVKAFTRCGMGPCQGRICGPLVSAFIADTLDKPIGEIGSFRPRAPFKPITVGALAGLAASPAEAGA
jgi:NADPH-dependent 2,4-dienoyl-CoA reductase/sulfur reductase-like enzyme